MPGGEKKTESSQSTSSNAINPQQLAQLQQNYGQAQTNANSLTGYTGQLTAGFNPTQLQAQGVLSGIGKDQSGQQNINSAADSIRGILGTDPLASANLSKYQNPFQSQVIDATIADQERARQIANVADNQKASAAGAFGGSRSAVLNSLTNEANDRNTGSLLANLNSQNFTQSQNAALASAGLTLNAAGQLVSTSQAGLQDATQRAGILSAVGDAQQQQDQTGLTAQYNEFLRQQGLGAQKQSILNSALGIIPVQQTVSGNNNSTSQTSTNPGLAGILGGVASLGLGIGSLGTSSLLGSALSGGK